MSPLKWINPFNKVVDLASELIEDKDKLNQFQHEATMAGKELQKMAEDTYRKELDTQTVPWVDALHKMGRQITGYLCIGLSFYMVYEGYDFQAVMAAMAPGGIYAWQKGKGK